MAHDDMKPVLANKWGALKHPTVVDLCKAMSNARDIAEGEPVVGARTDIKSAYTRIMIRPIDCTVMAKLISMTDPGECGPMIAIPIVNQWGSQVAGYAFDVITRALRRRAHERGGSDKYVTIIYVDDHITFGTISKVQTEVEMFMNDSRMLLGYDAIQESKNEQGTRIDAIGWRCDCNDWTVPVGSVGIEGVAKITSECGDATLSWRVVAEDRRLGCKLRRVHPLRPCF
jgi:hypothetical protein